MEDVRLPTPLQLPRWLLHCRGDRSSERVKTALRRALNDSLANMDDVEDHASKPENAEHEAATDTISDSQPSCPLVVCDPACFIISHSISKKHNLGTIARSATAFGVKQVTGIVCVWNAPWLIKPARRELDCATYNWSLI